MTIVCYDGETLAADKMSRVRGEDGKRRVKSLTREKITGGFEYAHFKGEPILIVGRSGLTKLSTEVVGYLKTHKTTRALATHLGKRFPSGVARGCRMLFVTPNSVFRVSVSKDFKITSKRFDRTAKVAVGAGYRTAEFMMQVQGVTAVHAVQALQGFYPGCGGGVDYSTRLQQAFESKVKTLAPAESTQQRRREYLLHLQSTIQRELSRLD